jgi:hypothetical protein
METALENVPPLPKDGKRLSLASMRTGSLIFDESFSVSEPSAILVPQIGRRGLEPSFSWGR